MASKPWYSSRIALRLDSIRFAVASKTRARVSIPSQRPPFSSETTGTTCRLPWRKISSAWYRSSSGAKLAMPSVMMSTASTVWASRRSRADRSKPGSVTTPRKRPLSTTAKIGWAPGWISRAMSPNGVSGASTYGQSGSRKSRTRDDSKMRITASAACTGD